MHHEQSASLSTGIGAYTGAAIASIACGEQAAVVDANVVRVLARLLKIGDDPSSKAATLRFAAEAAALLSPDRPGDFNQESLSYLFLTKQTWPLRCNLRRRRRHYSACTALRLQPGGTSPRPFL